MTDKNIFPYKLFSLLNISGFNLFFCENCNAPWKKSPPFPRNSPTKVEVLSSPLLLFENLVGGSTPQQKGGGMHTMCSPLRLIPNLNKKSVKCHNESWWHNFSNLRFSGMGNNLIKKKCSFIEKPWTQYIYDKT